MVLIIYFIVYIYVRYYIKEIGVVLENIDVLSVIVGGWVLIVGLILVSSVRIVVLWCICICSVYCINLMG